jgi:hypothetical protein
MLQRVPLPALQSATMTRKRLRNSPARIDSLATDWCGFRSLVHFICYLTRPAVPASVKCTQIDVVAQMIPLTLADLRGQRNLSTRGASRGSLRRSSRR